VHGDGSYHSAAHLANITIAGLATKPQHVKLNVGSQSCRSENLSVHYDSGVLKVTGLERYTGSGAWEEDIEVSFGW
jgi:hypothetical protein